MKVYYITPEMMIFEYDEHNMDEIIRTSNDKIEIGEEDNSGSWSPPF